jgi:hypothetical protein
MKYRECFDLVWCVPLENLSVVVEPFPIGGAIIDTCPFLDSMLQNVSSAV